MAGVSGRSGGARVGSGGARPGAGRPRKAAVPKTIPAPVIATCTCGAEYAQTGRGRKKAYCSPECRAAAKYERRSGVIKQNPPPPREHEPRPCALQACSALFAPAHGAERYCSPACKASANQVLAREAGERRSIRDRSQRACKQCGSSFAPSYGDPRRLYCSQTCRKKALARGGGDTHRERAKRYGVAYEPIHKVTVFNECGWQCQLCGKDTPRELMGTHDKAAPELDHIQPLSRGGAHVRSNVHLACRECNMSKGARLNWTPVPRVSKVCNEPSPDTALSRMRN